jgi:hypothetical protein
MTTDTLLNMAINVILPFLMALGGGILAAKALTSETEKRMWIFGFILIFLLCVGLSFVQQVRDTTAKESARAQSQQRDLQSSGEIKYMQGELDSINRVLGTLSSNSNPNQVAAVLKSLMPEETKLSRKQLCNRATALAQKIRLFQSEFESQEMDASMRESQEFAGKTREELRARGQQIALERERRNDNHTFEFRNQYMSDAKYIHDQIMNRLTVEQRDALANRNKNAESNLSLSMLSGAFNEYQIAGYLDELAKTLCSQS